MVAALLVVVVAGVARAVGWLSLWVDSGIGFVVGLYWLLGGFEGVAGYCFWGEVSSNIGNIGM